MNLDQFKAEIQSVLKKYPEVKSVTIKQSFDIQVEVEKPKPIVPTTNSVISISGSPDVETKVPAGVQVEDNKKKRKFSQKEADALNMTLAVLNNSPAEEFTPV